MDYIKAQYTKINIPKVIHYAQMNAQWPELVFLYIKYDEYDNAALAIINHSADAWEHAQFKDVVAKVSNIDICYKAIQFYLGEHPLLVNDLMSAINSRVDHNRVVQLARRMNQLALMKPYLQTVQEKNLTGVNEALNELYIDDEDYVSLRSSIDHFDQFDAVKLAQSIEKHELLEFRRVAAYIYKKNQRWAQSVDLSKQDKMYKDAIETAAESKKQDVAEGILEFFVQNNLKECFAACLYSCYDIIRPDIALELAWKNKILDFAFPYFIQVVREYVTKVDSMYKDTEKKKKVEEAQADQSNFVQPMDAGLGGYGVPVTSQLAIGYYPSGQDASFGTGYGVGGVGMAQPYGVGVAPAFGQPGYGVQQPTSGFGF